MRSAQPLTGTTVLDLSQGVAGPYCGGLFAEHGARVIKVEPPAGDWMRDLGVKVAGQSIYTLYYNRGKEALQIDVSTPEGLAYILKLVERCDVLIQSARPGVMDKLGVGFQTVQNVNPAIIYVSISGYGQTGPDARQPMTDTIGQAFTGLMALNKGRDGIPHKFDFFIIDVVTGLYAFQQASMALMSRLLGQTSEACHLDVSLAQSSACLQATKIMEFSKLNEVPALLNAPAGSYPTSDGWLAVTLVREAHFPAICQMLQRDDLAADPRFATFTERGANLPALRAILDAEFATQPTEYWLARAQEFDCLAAAVNTYGDWMADPQTQATQGAPATDVGDGEPIAIPRTPAREPYDAAGPMAGAHTHAILRELGASDEEIAHLIASGVARAPAS